MSAQSFTKDDFKPYVPGQETITLWFIRKETRVVDGVPTGVDTPLFWADVRADLTFAERERMQKAISEINAPAEKKLAAANAKLPKEDRLDDMEIKRKASLELDVKELWNVMAPYVIDWSVGEMVDGKAVTLDPPAVAGGKQFEHLNETFTTQIFTHLWTRSQGDVDVDFLGRSKRTAKTSDGGNMAAMKANG